MSRVERGDERGMAMVISVVVSMVAIVLVTMVLAMGVHLDSSTFRERRWQQALQVAEAGVEHAVVKLNGNLNYPGETAPVTVSGGEFEVKVTNLGSSRQIDALGWVPSKTHTNPIKRRIQVVYAPAPSFKYALFSSTALTVKNGGSGKGVEGDVFANESILIKNGSWVHGNVISATGSVQLENNAEIHLDSDGNGGTVYAGGFNSSGGWAVNLANNTKIFGGVHAQATDCAALTLDQHDILNQGSVAGGMVLPEPANLSGNLPGGTVTKACQEAFATTNLPTYQYPPDPALYPDLTAISYNQVTTTQFNALPSGFTLSGLWHVTDDGSGPLKMSQKTVVDDMALVTNARISFPNSLAGIPFFSSTLTGDELVQIITVNTSTSTSAPAIDVENHLAIPSPAPAVLIYAAGFCDLKNSIITNGAVYCNGMNIKNNLTIDYDERIERVVGFGSHLYTRASFVELSPGTPL